MENILEMFQGMGATQLAMLALGVWLLWPKIQELLNLNKKDEEDTNVVDPVLPDVDPPKNDNSEVVVDDINLTQLVHDWETLTDKCCAAGLDDACAKLKDVFPLLVKVRESE